MRALWFGTVALVALAASPANADFINFAQFGPTGTALGSPTTGTTVGGVPFSISDTGNAGFTEFCEDKSRLCAPTFTWAGEFFLDEVILFNNGAVSPVDLSFATPITSLTDLQAQSNAPGAFTETLTAYDGSTVVDTDSADWTNGVSGPPGEGTIPTLSVAFAGGITSISISTTNDSEGFALGGIGGVNNSGVPEPSTWGVMAIGLAGLSLAWYRGRRKTTASGS